MNREFPCNGTIHADLKLSAGRLEVVAGDRQTATVSITPLDSSEASAQAVEECRVELVDGHRLLVSAPEHGGWRLFRRAKLLVRVELPADSALSVSIASADASITGRYHDVVVNTASGDVEVERVTGDTSVNTASGDVRLGEVGGALRVKSASGDVRTGQVGGEITVHTASGDVEIEAAARDAKVTTASGDVAFGITRQGEIRINTASGDVTVGVAAGTGVWLDVNTVSGRTASDLSMPGSPVATGHSLTIKTRTASGDVTLRRVNG
ncbi:DUF4097 family beta strand repeat-containing protein [Catellatospora tritici]|uniref:DUF4097 family beta strand repeat-containing protein n=1 Tax=Catellatospora tritici TaxID=2851566 RepID=UPI001C2D6963|nr:DUF4097 family beta strand repeat-containing protein [Catellatospora tritici]MBV1848569.1 DUF4097 domain-containing protein [Catellatospora tritici]MBV1851411.1 DUF4097 domain-containing protein [Catellatospora tritici]